MNNGAARLFLVAAVLALGGRVARAQDSVGNGGEPIDRAIDPARLTYDYLVDGRLERDDPAAKKFKTLQAAYAAAPEGTADKPTVIGIEPNVYQLPGGAPRTPSLSVRKNYLTFLGLTNNRRAVVLADNRGLMQGADDDGYILDVNAIGFTAKNLTIINYCNADYEYPGDPAKNLAKRSDVITQGVALQASGDRHVYENVALLGRLDTMFLRTARSYFKNVYIEGTDDWMGGGQISVWEDCTLVYPTGSGVMSASVADDWDPAGARAQYEPAEKGSEVYRMALTGGSPAIRTGGAGATLGAAVTPLRAAGAPITWSTTSGLVSLSRSTGPDVVVTARNRTDQAEWVPIQATAPNGFHVTAYVYAEPAYLPPPVMISGPTLNPPVVGAVTVDYRLDLGGREDQSLISWFICDDAAGDHPRKIAVSRGDQPLKTLPLTAGDIGRYLKVAIQPKHAISDPGPERTTVAPNPISAAEVREVVVSPNFRNFVPEINETYTSGLWTVLGNWAIVPGDNFPHGYGIRPSTPAFLLYQQDADCGDMQIDVVMTPEKTEGTGFSIPGSPADSGERNLHSDIYIKYDPRTRSGYALRFWRTTQSAAKCMFQFYRIDHGAGSPLDSRQTLSGVFKPTTHVTLKATGTTLTAHASNNVDGETLALEGTIAPNRFGGAGVNWPRGSSNVYSQIEISYPGGTPGKSP